MFCLLYYPRWTNIRNARLRAECSETYSPPLHPSFSSDHAIILCELCSPCIWYSTSKQLWPSYAIFPQDHYDWGLRAIKSVLVVAGSLKRGDPDRPEDQVLMRSLRDFNIPKIVTDDMPVFMGLIGDLFPALDVPRKRDLDFEAVVRKAIVDLKLQAEDNFVLKVCGAFPDMPLCLWILYLDHTLSFMLHSNGILDVQICT